MPDLREKITDFKINPVTVSTVFTRREQTCIFVYNAEFFKYVIAQVPMGRIRKLRKGKVCALG
jgi:hypothetical protein